MKSIYTAVLLFLVSLSALAVEQDAATPDVLEPLSTPYLVIIGLLFVGMLAGMYWYYMRWDDEEDEPRSK